MKPNDIVNDENWKEEHQAKLDAINAQYLKCLSRCMVNFAASLASHDKLTLKNIKGASKEERGEKGE